MSLTELETVVRKHLLLGDNFIIKLLCAFVVAARLQVKPPWLFIVAGSSGGKSTILQALENVAGVMARDDFSVNTFVSGMKNQDGTSNSLLEKMPPNAILVVKDLSLLMSKDEKVRGEILGIFRQIYDGTFQKSYGNSLSINVKKKLSLLAGTTTKIYTVLYQFSALGERYLLYNFTQPDRKLTTKKSLSSDSMIDKVAEDEIAEAFKSYLDGIEIPKELPAVEESFIDEIVDIAELVTRARSVVERNMRDPKKSTTQVHDLEMPMRFAKQINAIAYGLKIINGDNTLTESDKKLIYKLALDCIPVMRRICLRKLTQYRTISTAGLAESLQLPTDTVRLPLEDLASLGVATRIRVKSNRDEWELKPFYKKLLAKYEGIAITNRTLDEGTEAENDETDESLRTVAEEIIDIENEEESPEAQVETIEI